MGLPAVGDIALLQFPFSDLSEAKRRPALLLANAGRGDWIVCQITSKPFGDPQAVCLVPDFFAAGTLPLASYARPGKLFTANERIIRSIPAALKPAALEAIGEAVIALVRSA